MTRPSKHPKTDMYWVRKVVPKDLRSVIEKRELKRSLQTKDPLEAKRLATSVIAEFESIVANARIGHRSSALLDKFVYVSLIWRLAKEWPRLRAGADSNHKKNKDGLKGDT